MPVNIGLDRSINIARGVSSSLENTRNNYQNLLMQQERMAQLEQERMTAKAVARMDYIQKQHNNIDNIKAIMVEDDGINKYKTYSENLLGQYNKDAELLGLPKSQSLGEPILDEVMGSYEQLNAYATQAYSKGIDPSASIDAWFAKNKELFPYLDMKIGRQSFDQNAAEAQVKELNPDVPQNKATEPTGTEKTETGTNTQEPTKDAYFDAQKAFTEDKAKLTEMGDTATKYINPSIETQLRLAIGTTMTKAKADSEIREELQTLHNRDNKSLMQQIQSQYSIVGAQNDDDTTKKAFLLQMVNDKSSGLTKNERQSILDAATGKDTTALEQYLKACNYTTQRLQEDRLRESLELTKDKYSYKVFSDFSNGMKGYKFQKGAETDTVVNIVNSAKNAFAQFAPEVFTDNPEAVNDYVASVIAVKLDETKYTPQEKLDIKLDEAKLRAAGLDIEKTRQQMQIAREMANSNLATARLRRTAYEAQLAGVYDPDGNLKKTNSNNNNVDFEYTNESTGLKSWIDSKGNIWRTTKTGATEKIVPKKGAYSDPRANAVMSVDYPETYAKGSFETEAEKKLFNDRYRTAEKRAIDNIKPTQVTTQVKGQSDYYIKDAETGEPITQEQINNVLQGAVGKGKVKKGDKDSAIKYLTSFGMTREQANNYIYQWIEALKNK